jgi:16S rRNA (guanine966-N2)-methyltransferase
VSQVRIQSGRWKGRTLEVPRRARPTSSRAREALFDILQDRIAGARVLDLFAGSGAVGLEALSRGAASAVFVESDPEALEVNVETLGAGGGEVEILSGDARRAVAALSGRGERFDLVFADPPYTLARAIPRSIADVLAPEGTLVVQCDSDAAVPDISGLAPVQRRVYGRNVFLFFGRSGA